MPPFCFLEDDFFLKNLKTRWELSAFSSKKEELLLHKGLLLGNPSLYLDGFLSVKNASFSDVLSVMESCFPEKPFTAYSKTLKK